MTGIDNHKTVMDSHSKCEPALNTEHKGDKEEGKLYNWLNWLIFLMREASLETRQFKTAVTDSHGT